MFDHPATDDPATQDPRARRTRKAVLDAATELTTRGELVTMQRIAAEAGVSRSALYAQFSGLDDVAAACLAHTFADIGADDIVARAAEGAAVASIAARAASRLAHHVDERRAFYRSALDWAVTARGHDFLEDRYAAIVEASMKISEPDLAPDERADVARFVAGGSLSLIRCWLRSDDPVTPEQMAARLVAAMPASVVGRPHHQEPGGPASSSKGTS